MNKLLVDLKLQTYTPCKRLFLVLSIPQILQRGTARSRRNSNFLKQLD